MVFDQNGTVRAVLENSGVIAAGQRFELNRYENRLSQYPNGYVAGETIEGLQAKFLETLSRKMGTGEIDALFEVVNSEYLLVVSHGEWDAWEGRFYAGAYLVPNWRKEYAKKCRQVAAQFNLPMEVALAVGNCPEEVIAALVAAKRPVSNGEKHELLECGIFRRKQAILAVVGPETYYQLRVADMGQKNSTRLANWLAE